MKRLAAACLMTFVSHGALASMDYLPEFTHLTFETKFGYKVEIHLDSHESIDLFRVWVHGKLLDVPKTLYSEIVRPSLRNVEVTGSDDGSSTLLEIPVPICNLNGCAKKDVWSFSIDPHTVKLNGHYQDKNEACVR